MCDKICDCTRLLVTLHGRDENENRGVKVAILAYNGGKVQ